MSIGDWYFDGAEAEASTVFPPGTYLDESGDYDTSPIRKLIAKAWFETAQ